MSTAGSSRNGTVAFSVPACVIGVAGEQGWIGTGRTRDVRSGGAAVELDEPAPRGLTEGSPTVLIVDCDGRQRHLARVARIDATRQVLGLMVVKPSGREERWAEVLQLAERTTGADGS